MSIPFLLPIPTIVSFQLAVDGELLPLATLCERAGVACRASGAWIERKVRLITESDRNEISVQKEAGDWGEVRIFMPPQKNKQDAYRLALSVMAYSVFDYVARESIRHAEWRKIPSPKGRVKNSLKAPLTNAERQRLHRLRAKG